MQRMRMTVRHGWLSGFELERLGCLTKGYKRKRKCKVDKRYEGFLRPVCWFWALFNSSRISRVRSAHLLNVDESQGLNLACLVLPWHADFAQSYPFSWLQPPLDWMLSTSNLSSFQLHNRNSIFIEKMVYGWVKPSFTVFQEFSF